MIENRDKTKKKEREKKKKRGTVHDTTRRGMDKPFAPVSATTRAIILMQKRQWPGWRSPESQHHGQTGKRHAAHNDALV